MSLPKTRSLETAQWGWALTVSALFVAATGPILGAVADTTGRRKPWIAVFTATCIIACCLLWFVKPGVGATVWALLLFAIANIAFELSSVFYNAMLPGIATGNKIGRLSGWAWGFGNAGALAALATVYFGVAHTDLFSGGLDRDTFESARISGPTTGLWFLVFALPLFFFVTDGRHRPIGLGKVLAQSLDAVMATLRGIGEHANVLYFLIARMLYTDGLTTLLAFAGIFATGSFGLGLHEILLLGIGLNAMAGTGAAAFGWVDDWVGPKRTLLFCLAASVILGSALLIVKSVVWFWILALGLGLFFGPLYAASRSMMARLAPEAHSTQMFGLYALSGKATTFLGPLLLAWVTVATDSQRAGLATILVFFLVGGLFLLKVKMDPA